MDSSQRDSCGGDPDGRTEPAPSAASTRRRVLRRLGATVGLAGLGPGADALAAEPTGSTA